MIDYTDVDAKLEEYSDAFDFYMECGEMPPTMPKDDCLAGYMQEVIDSNPQIDGSDPTWVEVLKEGLMSYLNQLIYAFATAQHEAEQEAGLIDKFESATLEQKRALWKNVYNTIRQNHSKYEVYIDGYSELFKTNDKDFVFKALADDWRCAIEKSLQRKQLSILNRTKKEWEHSIQEIGERDYKERRKIANIVYKSPQLKEIVEIIGRAKESTNDEDNIIYHYLPKGSKKGLPSEDVDSIENGDDLNRVVPIEFAMPEDLFYMRFVSKELQIISPVRQRAPLKTELHRPKPRPKKGPIIVAIDTSGSMYGRPEQIAKSLLIQLVKIARKDWRSCYLITFSVRIRTIDLGRSANLLKMKEFLNERFTGGNGEEKLLVEALRLLEKGDYEMADVLVISDFIFNLPTQSQIERVDAAKAKGTRFYGLQINSTSTAFDKILTKKWRI